MYTYKISQRLCEILNTEFIEHPFISDQLLCEVPQHEITSSRGTRQPNVDGELSPMFGKHHSDETKKLISEKAKGRTSPRKGIVLSEETKQKIRDTKAKNPQTGDRNPMFGRKHSDEAKRRWSELRKGKNPKIKGISLRPSSL